MPMGDGRKHREQIPPGPGVADASERAREVLIALLDSRQRVGLERYGRPLETWNGRDAMRDLLEELIDALQYAVQVQMEIDDRDETIERLRVQLDETRALVTELEEAISRAEQRWCSRARATAALMYPPTGEL